jgi:predicted dehydrogenase
MPLSKSIYYHSTRGKGVSRHRKSKGKAGCFSKSQVDSDFKTVKQVVCEGALGEIVEAEFHFDRYNPALSPKQHKETVNAGAGMLKDLGPHLIDQALHLFVFNAVYADIRTTRAQSVVDD